jgi:hypothetical protein
MATFKMNEVRFHVERAEEGRIDIRDRSTGVLFTFVIRDGKLSHLLKDAIDPIIRKGYPGELADAYLRLGRTGRTAGLSSLRWLGMSAFRSMGGRHGVRRGTRSKKTRAPKDMMLPLAKCKA